MHFLDALDNHCPVGKPLFVIGVLILQAGIAAFGIWGAVLWATETGACTAHFWADYWGLQFLFTIEMVVMSTWALLLCLEMLFVAGVYTGLLDGEYDFGGWVRRGLDKRTYETLAPDDTERSIEEAPATLSTSGGASASNSGEGPVQEE